MSGAPFVPARGNAGQETWGLHPGSSLSPFRQGATWGIFQNSNTCSKVCHHPLEDSPV